MSRTSVERTPDGRRLVVSRTVHAPATAAWTVLTDTEAWPAWGPSVSAVDCDERFVSAGTRGRVRVGPVWVPFVVDTCADHRWTWRVARIPATGHRVEELSAGRCRVAFEVPLLAAGYATVCAVALRRIDRLARDRAGSDDGAGPDDGTAAG